MTYQCGTTISHSTKQAVPLEKDRETVVDFVFTTKTRRVIVCDFQAAILEIAEQRFHR